MTEEVKAPKAKAEVTLVKMDDGREVGFAGKRRMIKTSDITPEGVTTRFDFVNGETRSITITPEDPLALKLIGHGLQQKVGDETAGDESVDDMILHVDAILERLAKGEWGAERSGTSDGFSGASVVVRAIMEASGKDQAFVKAFLEKKLEQGKADGLTRQKLYAAYKRPGTKTAEIIDRITKEKLAKETPSVDVDAELAEMAGE